MRSGQAEFTRPTEAAGHVRDPPLQRAARAAEKRWGTHARAEETSVETPRGFIGKVGVRGWDARVPLSLALLAGTLASRTLRVFKTNPGCLIVKNTARPVCSTGLAVFYK